MILPLILSNTSTITFTTNLIGKYRFRLLYASIGLNTNSTVLSRLTSDKLFNNVRGQALYLPTTDLNYSMLGDFPEFEVELVDGTFNISFATVFNNFNVNVVPYSPVLGILTFDVVKL